MGLMYKLNAITGKFDLVNNPSQLGDSSTYINVDTTNKKIQIYVNGTLVNEWVG